MLRNADTVAGCAYAVDGHDRIVAVDDAWIQFAMDNDGESLVADRVLRRNLWDFVRGIENRLIYKRILDHVRLAGESISFEFRCDSPVMERHLRMEVTPLLENGCLFQTRPVRCEAREPVLLLSRVVQRSLCSVAICGWCMGVEVAGRWSGLTEAADRLAGDAPAWPSLAHTICPICFERLDGLLASTRLTWRRATFGASFRQ